MGTLALALLGGAVSVCATTDWPQWRGPARDGLTQETGLLQEWPAGGPPLLWKATGLGLGHATVSIAGDHIYSAGDRGQESFVVALQRIDGKLAWSSKLGKAGAPGWGNFKGVRGTPTVDDGRVFAIGQYGELVAYDARSGQEIWRHHLEDDFGGKRPEWGFSESPLIDGDHLVCTPGGEQGAVVALDKKTGKPVWRSKEFTDEAQYASLIVAEVGGVRQYIQLTMQSVAGVAATDGRLLWRADRKGRTAVITTPIYADDHVYVTSDYGIGCNLFEISLNGNEFSAEEVYANRVMKNQHGGVIKIDGHVYGYSGGVGWVAQDFKTGEAVWENKKDLDKGSIAYADGRLYLREEDKSRSEIALIEATPNGYEERGRFQQPDQSGAEAWAHPVVFDGRLYIRDQDLLLCYNVRRP